MNPSKSGIYRSSKVRSSNKFNNTETCLESRVLLSATDVEPDNNTLANAYNLGTVGSGINTTLSGDIGISGDTQDHYKFTVDATRTASGTINLTGLSANADILIFGPGGYFRSSANAGSASEQLTPSNLVAGTYTIRILQNGSAVTTYSLQVSLSLDPISSTPQDAYENNNSMATAYNLGAIGTGLNRTLQGNIGFSSDLEDNYRFTVDSGRIASGTISLSGLAANADLQIFGPNSFFRSSANFGTANEQITLSNLVAGNYNIRVLPYNSTPTIYTLQVNLTLNPVSNPVSDIYENNNTIATASDLGFVGTGMNRTLQANIGYNGDSLDHYKFTVDANRTASGTITLSGLSANADILIFGPGGYYSSSAQAGTSSEQITPSNLVAGTYTIRVLQNGSAATTYSLQVNLTLDPIASTPQDAFENNNFLETAYNLGTVGLIMNRTLQANIGYSNDTLDHYKFTVESGRTVSGTITLSGLSANADIQIFGPNSFFKSSANFGTANDQITLSRIVAGNYVIRVIPYGSTPTNYNLQLNLTPDQSVSPDPNGSNNTSNEAINLGNLLGTSATRNEFLYPAGSIPDSLDYYRFSLGTVRKPNLRLVLTVTVHSGNPGDLQINWGISGSRTTSGNVITINGTVPGTSNNIPPEFGLSFSSNTNYVNYTFTLSATSNN